MGAPTKAKVKVIHLLRHAKAEASGPSDSPHEDHARPLAKRGEKAAAALAAHMKETGFTVDRIYCSTAIRARQTLEPIRAVLPGVPTSFRESLYLVETDTLFAFLQSLPEIVGSVLIVGHNPTSHHAALTLIDKVAAGEGEAMRELKHKFPTGALCSIECKISKWASLAPKTGTLTGFLRPKDITD